MTITETRYMAKEFPLSKDWDWSFFASEKTSVPDVARGDKPVGCGNKVVTPRFLGGRKPLQLWKRVYHRLAYQSAKNAK